MYGLVLSYLISLLSVSFLKDDMKEYDGPSPAVLLEPLFKQSSCSYRVSFISQFLFIAYKHSHMNGFYHNYDRSSHTGHMKCATGSMCGSTMRTRRRGR